jgi:alkanesulfonate monooxygenase SsuD/methylene tetrahydromethanopterin reductase-like flavin-dependent oxidoreductase (luciferase family)
LDPLLVLAIIAGVTKHIGLACTVSASYFEPFVVARAMATLDHLSNGRSAWNIVTSFQEAEARNFGRNDQLSREQRYDRADEFMQVACKLWDSWQDGALIRDRDTPIFADPSRVHSIDHDGTWLNVRGPLNVSRSPQGRPLFVQAGASDRGCDFAARLAEIVVVTPGGPDAARDSRLDRRAHRDVVETVYDVLRSENAWARAHKQEAGDIWAKELGLPAAVAARFGEFNTNPIGPVGPAETTHIENITDWYVENRIIPTRPEIAPFVSDLSQR